MPDNSAYHGICTLSKALRATTLNFCLVVSGATWPEPSRVRKLGSARKSRSFDVPAFDVPAFFPWSPAFCPPLFLSLSLSESDGVCDAGTGAVGFDGGGVCCAADGRERKEASKTAISGWANFIDKHLS